MQPDLGFVVADGLFCLVAVGNVNVGKTIVVEIERTAAPGPTGARDGIVERRLLEPPIGPREVEPVPECHARTHRVVFENPRSPQIEMFQTIRDGRIHSNHQNVKSSVRVEVRQRVCHAERMRLGDPLASDVAEMTATVVPVKINARKIADAAMELFSRIKTFVEHFAAIRDGLDKAAVAYNRAVGSYESRVVPGGERLLKLSGAPSDAALPEAKASETVLRSLPDVGSV